MADEDKTKAGVTPDEARKRVESGTVPAPRSDKSATATPSDPSGGRPVARPDRPGDDRR